MAEIGIKDLLQAGVHFGHQTRRWNPRMARFIHGEHSGVHVIDLLQTVELLASAAVPVWILPVCRPATSRPFR